MFSQGICLLTLSALHNGNVKHARTTEFDYINLLARLYSCNPHYISDKIGTLIYKHTCAAVRGVDILSFPASTVLFVKASFSK